MVDTDDMRLVGEPSPHLERPSSFTDDMRLVGEPSPHPERPSSFTADYNIFDHGQHLHEKELVFLDAETMRRREETIRRESGRVRIVKPMLRRSPNWE